MQEKQNSNQSINIVHALSILDFISFTKDNAYTYARSVKPKLNLDILFLNGNTCYNTYMSTNKKKKIISFVWNRENFQVNVLMCIHDFMYNKM